MAFETITVEAKGDILIEAPSDAVFEFITSSETRVDAVSPLDANRKAGDDMDQDSLGVCELRVGGQVLNYETRSRVIEPARRFEAEMQGDVNGEQVFNLGEEMGGTRLELELRYDVPPTWPSYYREEPTKTLFAETLVSQTLANIKAALESGS